MGEMADFYLSSQNDYEFYEECALQGYRAPSYVYRMPTFEDIKSPAGKRYFPKKQPSSRAERKAPDGCWIDKNGEVHEIRGMSDQYLNNLIAFLEKHPHLIKQNPANFEQMIEERYRRTKL